MMHCFITPAWKEGNRKTKYARWATSIGRPVVVMLHVAIILGTLLQRFQSEASTLIPGVRDFAWKKLHGSSSVDSNGNYDHFGRAVAISDSGNTVAISSWADTNAADSGAVHIYNYDSGSDDWIWSQSLTASESAREDYFGVSVAMSGDVLAVGSYLDDNARGNDAGSVYVFEYDPATSQWDQTERLEASDGSTNDRLGWSVDTADGTTIVAGATNDNQGAAYVWTRQNTSSPWSQSQKIVASVVETSDQYGWHVAVSGNHIAVSSWNLVPEAGTSGEYGGTVYIFKSNGAEPTPIWNEYQTLVPSDVRNRDLFGNSISMSGSRMVIGAPHWRTDGGVETPGYAYVYDLTSGGMPEYSLTQKLAASDGEIGDQFGYGVAVDGDIIVVGARADGTSASGSAYLFQLDSNTWTATHKLELASPTGGASDWVGQDVAISGTTALIGSNHDSNTAGGFAYILRPTCGIDKTTIFAV